MEFARGSSFRALLNFRRSYMCMRRGISGLQRSGDARGDCLCPPTKFQYWAVAYGGHYYWKCAVCNVIFTFANQRFGKVCWHNMHIILHALSLLFVQCIIVININYNQRSKLGDRNKTQHSMLQQSGS